MPVQQALSMLGLAFPQVPAANLARLPIGQRDACLLRLRELTFGSRLKGLADCPACHERLEMDFDAGDLYDPSALPVDGGTVEPARSESSFRVDAYELTFRLPTSADLTALAAYTGAAPARAALLNACLVSVRRDGESVDGGSLPAEVLNALEEKMAAADPSANLTLALNCPACGHTWQIIFDIVSYLWSEVNAWSARLLREVHILAAAYGWREADILALSAWRRQCYLEMIGI